MAGCLMMMLMPLRHSFIFIIAMIFFATLLWLDATSKFLVRICLPFLPSFFLHLAISHSILIRVKRLCVFVCASDPMHQRGGWWFWWRWWWAKESKPHERTQASIKKTESPCAELHSHCSPYTYYTHFISFHFVLHLFCSPEKFLA